MSSRRSANFSLHAFPLGALQEAYSKIIRGQKGAGWERSIKEVSKDEHGGVIRRTIPSTDLNRVNFSNATDILEIHSTRNVSPGYTTESIDFSTSTHWVGLKKSPCLHVSVVAANDTRRESIEAILIQQLNLVPCPPDPDDLKKKQVALPVPAGGLLSILEKMTPQVAVSGAKTTMVPLPPPATVTLPWLWEHTPAKVWLTFGGILVGFFSFGVTVGENGWITQILTSIQMHTKPTPPSASKVPKLPAPSPAEPPSP